MTTPCRNVLGYQDGRSHTCRLPDDHDGPHRDGDWVWISGALHSPATGAPDLALTAEQEIRARALTVAVAYFADDDGDHAPLEILLRTAGTFAAWITDGPQTPAEGLDRSDPDPSAGGGGTGAQQPPQGADRGSEAAGRIDLWAAVEAIARADVGGLTATALERAERMVTTTAPHILQAAAEWLRGERTLDDGDPWNSGWHGAVDQLRALADEIGGGR